MSESNIKQKHYFAINGFLGLRKAANVIYIAGLLQTRLLGQKLTKVFV